MALNSRRLSFNLYLLFDCRSSTVQLYITVLFDWSDERVSKYATFDDNFGVDFAYSIGPSAKPKTFTTKFGLFAVISALSIVEGLYFMTLRYVVNFWKLLRVG
jgi:hypothetical protein